MLAASPGFEVPDTFSAELLFVGVALFAAIGALSAEKERPFSASIVYLGLGFAASAGIHLLDLRWIDPFDDASFIDHLTEVALIVALFASGLRVRRAFTWRRWRGPVVLLALVMPLTIAAVAAFAVVAMGLPWGVAILLGAVLAPTDPVLAGGIGLKPPGEELEENAARFNLTVDASMNDALAGPFVLLAFLLIERTGGGWAPEWVLADLLYASVFPVAVGALAGWGMAWLADRMRRRDMLSPELDGFFVIGVVLLVYGAVDALDSYGFLAVFAAGIAFRRYEVEHEYNRRAHDGAQLAQNFLELAVILVLGSLVTFDALEAPGVAGWLLAPLLILVIRPVLSWTLLAPTGMAARERAFVGFFGVKGVASIHYAAVALEEGVLTSSQAVTFFWTVALLVAVSLVFHGVTASPLSRRLSAGG